METEEYIPPREVFVAGIAGSYVIDDDDDLDW